MRLGGAVQSRAPGQCDIRVRIPPSPWTLARISIYEYRRDARGEFGESQREKGLPAVHGKARCKLFALSRHRCEIN
jgi:hypothetical protein